MKSIILNTITTNMNGLIKGKNIDVTKLSFSQPRVLDNGAKLVYMNYDGGRLSIQTPWLTLPVKMGVYTEGEYPKYSVDISFKGMENDPDLQAFHDKLQEVEETIVDAGFDNSVSWFKKKKTTREVVEAIFNPILKVSKDKETGEPDGKWPPTMKLKVARKNGVWESNKDKPLVVKEHTGRQYKINSEDSLEDVFVFEGLSFKFICDILEDIAYDGEPWILKNWKHTYGRLIFFYLIDLFVNVRSNRLRNSIVTLSVKYVNLLKETNKEFSKGDEEETNRIYEMLLRKYKDKLNVKLIKLIENIHKYNITYKYNARFKEFIEFIHNILTIIENIFRSVYDYCTQSNEVFEDKLYKGDIKYLI